MFKESVLGKQPTTNHVCTIVPTILNLNVKWEQFARLTTVFLPESLVFSQVQKLM